MTYQSGSRLVNKQDVTDASRVRKKEGRLMVELLIAKGLNIKVQHLYRMHRFPA